jgi:hypothetical protein
MEGQDRDIISLFSPGAHLSLTSGVHDGNFYLYWALLEWVLNIISRRAVRSRAERENHGAGCSRGPLAGEGVGVNQDQAKFIHVGEYGKNVNGEEHRNH